MKNILIYLNPSHSFDEETNILVKVQIDNAISLGWRKKDILLFTNFDYSYNGVTATILPDDLFCSVCPQGTKANAIVYLLENNILADNNEIYWFHDFDSHESSPIKMIEEISNSDVSLSDYGYGNNRWSTASFFFKRSAKDILTSWRDAIYEFNIGDEQAFMIITKVWEGNKLLEMSKRHKFIYAPEKVPEIKDIEKRVTRLNSSYCFIAMNLRHDYKIAIKPIMILHFHPFKLFRKNSIRSFDLYAGKNIIKTQLMSDNLLKIFSYHGVT